MAKLGLHEEELYILGRYTDLATLLEKGASIIEGVEVPRDKLLDIALSVVDWNTTIT